MPEKPLKLFFDESGFTGNNLLDKNQPVFVVGSTDVGNEAASELLHSAFPDYKGEEYKFQKIWKSNRSKNGLLKFSELVSATPDRFYVWGLDKRFTAFTKVVDFLIEPVLHECGYDFYADGFSRKYANYMYFGFEQVSTNRLLDTIIPLYHQFARLPSNETLSNLQVTLSLMKNSLKSGDSTKLFIEQMLIGAESFENFQSISSHRGSNDVQFTSVLTSVIDWRHVRSVDFEIHHDASSNFFRQKDMWDTITSTETVNKQISTASGQNAIFPLRVSKTISVNSETNPSIQLADILAGLASKIWNPQHQNPQDEFIKDVLKQGFMKIRMNGIFHEYEKPTFPPARLKGPDAVDQYLELMFPN